MNEAEPSREELTGRRSSMLGDLVAARDAIAAREAAGIPAENRSRLQSKPPAKRSGAVRALALLGAGGFLAFVVGLVLGVVSYDQRFIYDDRNFLWDAVGLFGYALFGVGLLLVVASILSIVLVVLVRAVRHAWQAL